jgi:DNA gyrase subunit A
MARRTTTQPPDGEDVVERIVDIDVADEMKAAFLEYSYSVIYARALPDARDGLKPVQRRILFGMSELGLRPDRPHVKSSRIVGEVMGKYHPHGDSAIYDALVRLAQPFSMRLPLVDGHGNFGSLDDGPAASRYTEARMAPAAMLMVGGLDEDTVDFVPNYDDTHTQPEVLPAAFPNLLVNGASGIAVGMATNMPPHNLVEVIGAARHLIDHPDASLDDLMRFVPGPGSARRRADRRAGRHPGGVRHRGARHLPTRATARSRTSPRDGRGIVVTELPYLVGPEKVIEKIRDLVQAKRLQGISDVKDLTDRKTRPPPGHRGQDRLRPGGRAGGALPAHPDGGLVRDQQRRPRRRAAAHARAQGAAAVFVDFRIRRRAPAHGIPAGPARGAAAPRRGSAHGDPRHRRGHPGHPLVRRHRHGPGAADGGLRPVRGAGDLHPRAAAAAADEVLPLELEREQESCAAEIEALRAILADERLLRRTVSDEFAEVAQAHGDAAADCAAGVGGGRGSGATAPARGQTAVLEVADDPCWVLLSSTGLLARTSSADPLPVGGGRARHDVIIGAVRATAVGEVGLVTSAGRMVRLSVLELPTLPPTADAPNLSGGAPLAAYLDLPRDEQPVTLASLAPDSPVLALGTAAGVVKRVVAEHPSRPSWELIALREGDAVVGAAATASEDLDLVFLTTDAQLLRFPAGSVRPQGRAAGGMAGIRLSPKARAVYFGVVDAARDGIVVTASGTSGALPGTQAGAIKVTPYAEYPAKGRGTGGVRCHRFLKGEDTLVLAWAGSVPARAAAANGGPVELPAATGRRDGSGSSWSHVVGAIAGPMSDG